MPPTDLLHTLLRRWYLALVGLVVTGGLIAASLILAPVSYTAQADVLLLPPKTTGADNPYLGLSDLQGVAATIARSILDDAAVKTLAAEGVSSGYTVTVDITTSAPLLLAKADGKTPAEAINAMNHVTALVAPTLQQLQQSQRVPTKYQITSTTIHADQTPTTVTKTRTRVLLAAVVAGLVFTALLAVGADRLLLRRRPGTEPESQANHLTYPDTTSATTPSDTQPAAVRLEPVVPEPVTAAGTRSNSVFAAPATAAAQPEPLVPESSANEPEVTHGLSVESTRIAQDANGHLGPIRPMIENRHRSRRRGRGARVFDAPAEWACNASLNARTNDHLNRSLL